MCEASPKWPKIGGKRSKKETDSSNECGSCTPTPSLILQPSAFEWLGVAVRCNALQTTREGERASGLWREMKISNIPPPAGTLLSTSRRLAAHRIGTMRSYRTIRAEGCASHLRRSPRFLSCLSTSLGAWWWSRVSVKASSARSSRIPPWINEGSLGKAPICPRT